jgi:hypothetical protein
MTSWTGFTLAVAALALCPSLGAQAQPANPGSGARVTVRPALIPCTTPVTPETVVPWIEVSALPDLSRTTASFEHCTNIDHAWTTQSYPDPKFTPPRTPEQEARVRVFLQGIKDYVAADAEDWGAYVNAWLGSTMPPPKVERSKPTSDGSFSVSAISQAKEQSFPKLGGSTNILGIYASQQFSRNGAQGPIDKHLTFIGLNVQELCVTPVDLQQAFENQPGYLFRPLRVRTSNRHPDAEELAKLGGQWFGYEVYVFAGSPTGQFSGRMSFTFQFKACANRIQIELTRKPDRADKP